MNQSSMKPIKKLIMQTANFKYKGRKCKVSSINPDCSDNTDYWTVRVTYLIHHIPNTKVNIFLDTYYWVARGNEKDIEEYNNGFILDSELFAMNDKQEIVDDYDMRFNIEKATDSQITRYIKHITLLTQGKVKSN